MNIKKLFRKDTKSRGQGQGIFGVFTAIGIGLVVVAILLGLGSYIITEIEDNSPTGLNSTGEGDEDNTAVRNITGHANQAVNTAGSWLNIFVIVAIAVAIIGLIFMFAGGVSGGRGVARGGGGGRQRL